jgi:lysozyme
VNQLYALIRRFEGLRLKAYLCPAGVWTVGYGSTGPGIGPGVQWTKEQSEERMRQDAQRFASAALKLCPRLYLAEPEKTAAIADFAYNLGSTRLAGSTLRKRINEGDWPAAQRELRKWVFGGGVKLPGLVLRREAEAKLLE